MAWRWSVCGTAEVVWKPRFLWQWPSAHLHFLVSFLIFLSTILDFMQLGLWASPPFLQTLGPWFPNGIQNLLSSEKRTLDHWATVQFFFSLAQVRRLWRCLWFRSGLTRGIRQLQPNSLTHLCVVALDALTPASVYSLWSSPKFLNRFCLTILIRLRFSRLVVHLFLPHFFLPLNSLLTCLDTALCRCFELISWLACHHILICWDSELVGLC